MGHLKAFKKDMQQNTLEPVARSSRNVNIHIPKENELKMSDVLMEFARPLLNNTKDEVEDNAALQMAITCWNLSYLPQQQINQTLDEFMRGDIGGVEKKIYLRLVFEKLIENRQKYYSDIKRLITDFKITLLPEEESWHLQVMSTPLNEDDLKDVKPDTDSQSR